jgi:hypothetical protein
MATSTFFVLAIKQVELRGEVIAQNREAAIRQVKENWHIYDHPEVENAVCAGTSSNPTIRSKPPPEISEYESPIKILYAEDTKYICKKCGQLLRNHNKDGSCRIDKFMKRRDKDGRIKKN